MIKFDYIIMNPPYNGSLHLKCLKHALTFKKDGGTLICLSPARWLQDPLWEYKKNSDYRKYKESIVDNISKLEIIKDKKLIEGFDASFTIDLAIYTFSSKKTLINIIPDEEMKFCKEIIIPILTSGKTCVNNLTKTSLGYDFILPEIHGNRNRKDRYDLVSRNYSKALQTKETRQCRKNGFLTFSSEEERKNFYNSLNCVFIKYIKKVLNISPNNTFWATPYMDDYTNPWTDERFFTYYKISEKDQTHILTWAEEYK